MIFTPTRLGGLFVVELQPYADERGSFARTYCEREFAAQGLAPLSAQSNQSHNRHEGTLRGMHFQTPPHDEAKLVRCARGRMWDVALDLRPDSETRGEWFGVELTDSNNLQLYIPAGFAHGFQTLCDDTEVFYQMSNFYQPEAAQGVRFDDPAFGIDWPLPVAEISPKDRQWPDFQPASR